MILKILGFVPDSMSSTTAFMCWTHLHRKRLSVETLEQVGRGAESLIEDRASHVNKKIQILFDDNARLRCMRQRMHKTYIKDFLLGLLPIF